MKKKQIAVGGQAVIEGVMMRGPKHIATAIRRKDDTIEVKKEEFTSITSRVKIFGLPLIRGFVSLIEMMKIGFKTLSFSASRFELDDEGTEKKKSNPSSAKAKAGEALSFVVAMVLALALFGILPYKSAEWFDVKNTVYFNAFAGVIRIVFFVIYLLLISLMKDVKRLFRYHGAEHKAVFCYEQNKELNTENCQSFSTLHPRCGTSFMFFVLLVSILIFSVVDTLLILKVQNFAPFIFETAKTGMVKLNTLWRLAIHLCLLPLVSGVSYEILRLSGKKLNHPLVKILTVPGMTLQKITTQPPDDKMVEVAIVALKSALELDIEQENIKYID